MPRTSSIELGSVQQTLLLPLWGRAVETGKAHPLLVDPAAVSILATIDYDFSTIARNISFITQLAWIARSLHTDNALRKFLGQNPAATVVNLGCGLDTTFERVDNGMLRWYDLDLPDVIELRRRFIAESERRKFIAGSLLADEWREQLAGAGPIFFIASGVLYYFSESDVKAFLIRMAESFPGSELLFDAASPRGVRIANQKVIQAGGMDSSAILKWGMLRASDLEAWDRRIQVVAAYPLFRGLKRGLSFKEKWGMLMSDLLHIMSMVHLRFSAQ